MSVGVTPYPMRVGALRLDGSLEDIVGHVCGSDDVRASQPLS